MTDDKLSEYLAYRTPIKRLLLIVGMWPHKNPRLRHRVLLVNQLLLNIMAVVIIGNFVRVHSDDVARVTKGISVMSGFLSSILKTVFIIVYHKEASELHQLLDPPFFKLLNNPRFSKIVADEVTAFRRFSAVLSYLLYSSCTTFITTPIISIIYQHVHGVYPIKYRLVLPGAYPWLVTPSGFLFKLHYLLESLSLIVTVAVAAGMDTLFGLYVFQIIGQFREMSYRITHIDEKEDYRTTIRECISQYQVLIRCRNILQKIYGPIVLWTMLINAIHLCGQMFEFSQMMSISLHRAVLTSAYLMFKLLQTFLYAWAGSRLTEESDKYKTAIYTADWHENKPFMSSIVIMLTQKPMVLTACNFSMVTMEIFVKVVNTAISYFFLLQTLED